MVSRVGVRRAGDGEGPVVGVLAERLSLDLGLGFLNFAVFLQFQKPLLGLGSVSTSVREATVQIGLVSAVDVRLAGDSKGPIVGVLAERLSLLLGLGVLGFAVFLQFQKPLLGLGSVSTSIRETTGQIGLVSAVDVRLAGDSKGPIVGVLAERLSLLLGLGVLGFAVFLQFLKPLLGLGSVPASIREGNRSRASSS